MKIFPDPSFRCRPPGSGRPWFFPLLVACLLASPSLRAEATPEELFKAGSSAFQSGDYDGAAKNFETLLTLGLEGESLQSVLFNLAATYYNQKNLPKAESYFNRLLKEFPDGKDKAKALISLAQIQNQTGRKEEAEKNLQRAAECGGELGGKARMAQVSLLVQAGKSDQAEKTLQEVIAGGVNDPVSVQAALSLCEIKAKKGELEEALKLLDQVKAREELVDNPMQFDILAVRIGDALLAKGRRPQALKMYSVVRPKQEVIRLQKERISSLENRITENKATLQTNPKAVMEISSANAGIQKNIEELKAAAAEFEKLPDTSVPVRIRQARAYEELDYKWETIVIWESLVETADPKIREDALFSIGSAYGAMGRSADADAAMDRYLREFPSGKYAAEANFLKGSVAMATGDFAKAETVFGTLIGKDDKSPLAPDMLFLMANCQFAQAVADPDKREKYKEAIENYKKYLSKYNDGGSAQEALFRIALCHFQLGDYAKALDGFRDYNKKYPKGLFTGDADYRIALCYNAAQKYDEVLKLCAEWETVHKGEMMLPEVLALEGDAYREKEMPAESAEAYRRSVQLAQTEELLKYSLFEANKQYQKSNNWGAIAEMFGRFEEKHPDHPAATVAVYWVSKAKIKEGKTSEAKQYLAETILKTIKDRKKDAVEQLLGLLAQTCAKRPRQSLAKAAPPPPTTPAADAPDAEAQATPKPRPTPAPLPPYDADGDFAKYLDDSKVGDSPLARARLRYARAQLAGFTKKQDRQNELMTSIYRDFTPDQLSAMLLAECGDIALGKGELDKAEAFYKELMTSFPKSDLMECAYCGMGEVALARNKPDEALRWFDDAVEKIGAESRIAQITYGKGRALAALNRPDEAKKIFEQVAGTKEWRGEVTAQALLALGDIEEKKGDLPAATQYYQRVFVAYQRYPEVVIDAYFKAADAFVKLNQPEKASAHLHDMLSKPRLAQNPRAEKARKMMEGLPPPAVPAGSPQASASPAPAASPDTKP